MGVALQLCDEINRNICDQVDGNVSVKCLTPEISIPPKISSHAQFKFMPAHHVEPISFYVYSDKYALVLAEEKRLF